MKKRVAITILLGSTVLAYVTGLPGTFHYDDVPTILNNTAVRSIENLPRYFADPQLFSEIKGNRMYRPVLLVTYLVDYGIGGFHPFVWHLTNILLHALCAILVFLLTRRLVAIFGTRVRPDLAGFLAGLAFALHPVHSEVVNYVSSRSGAIATAGLLGALLLHLAWTRGGGARLRRGLLLAGSLVCFAAGLGGKEIAIALVPAVFVLELLDPEGGPFLTRLRTAVIRTLPVLVLALLFLELRGHLLQQKLGLGNSLFEVKGKRDLNWGGGRSKFENLLTQSRVFWIYVRLLVFPVGLAVDRFVRVSTSLSEPSVLLSLLGIAVVLLVLALCFRRHRIVTFCGLGFGLGLGPTAIMPLNVVMNEHRLYLPGTFFAVLLGVGFAALIAKRRKAGIAVAAAIGVCWLAILMPRSLVWQDPWKLWVDNVEVSPRSFRGHNQLGSAHLTEAQRMGDAPDALPLLDKAIVSLSEAARLYPGWFHAQLNLGIAWRRRGRISKEDADFERSLHHFETCMEVSRNKWRARYQIASTYGMWKKYEEGLRRFREMAEEDRDEGGPRLSIYVRPMAALELERERFAEAEALYRELLDREPGDLDAILGLARTLARSGRTAEGAEVFRDILARRGSEAEVHLTFARFLIDLDPPDRQGAGAHFQRAMALGHAPTLGQMEKYLGP